MSSSIFVSPFTDAKSRSYLYSIFVGASLVCFVYFTGSALVTKDYHERTSKWSMQILGTTQEPKPEFCKNRRRPPGSEALPEGIVSHTSNLEMRPLWDFSMGKEKLTPPLNLLVIAVGVKQRMIVNKMVEKFLSSGFVVMLFHYDGIVDEWNDLEWYDHVIHVSAKNQTKWWFSKRFLQPDVIAEYDYVFLWDEDLDVENFHPQRYIDIVRSEGLEISQPALDPTKSVVHHPLTARQKNAGVHRRFYKFKGSGRCDQNSKAPPCIGWVEMMAPVFSKAAWRCVWHMIQNDLVHAWGLDRQLGYCAQGDRTKNVGIVDSEYIIHLGLSTLGVLDKNKELSESLKIDNRSATDSNSRMRVLRSLHSRRRQAASPVNKQPKALHDFSKFITHSRRFLMNYQVRRQSFMEMQMFNQRWKDAVKNDECWVDLFGQPDQQTTR